MLHFDERVSKCEGALILGSASIFIMLYAIAVDSAASVGVLGIVNLFTAIACWVTGRDEVMYYFYKRKQRKGK